MVGMYTMWSAKILRVLLFTGVANADTWCGKNYQRGAPVVPPGGNFVQPSTSSTPLLVFRCSPGVIPYLPSDVSSGGTLLVDTLITHTRVVGATALQLNGPSPKKFHVTATIAGKVVASWDVPVNSTKFEIPLSLKGLKTSMTPLDLSCSLTVPGSGGPRGSNSLESSSSSSSVQTIHAQSELSYLPENPHGSTTKRDLKTGALLARGTNGKGPYAPVFPVGFYTNFGGFLADNLTRLDDIKTQGCTLVHPIPTFDNLTALDAVLDRMEALGLWLMYDMRWTYKNLTAVREEVNRIKSRKNLLLWYTADEPDGWGDALNATTLAYDVINSIDTGYHPVSLVLNCQDYYYEQHAAGADILLQDTYVVGINATWSIPFDTPCTPDFGDCGCDNCKGSFTDVADRMDQFTDRNFALGWNKPIWTVPQGFGEESYWPRKPTGPEFIVQSALALNHDAKGVVSWNYPTTSEIEGAASQLAKAAPGLTPFVFSHTATFMHHLVDGVDVGVWEDGKKGVLVLATNTAYTQAKVTFAALGLKRGGRYETLLNSGAKMSSTDIVLDGVGTGVFVFRG